MRNLGPIFHRFWCMVSFLLRNSHFITLSIQPPIWECFLCTRWLKFWKFSLPGYDLKLSHNSLHYRRTDGRTTTMPIARSLLKYGGLKSRPNVICNVSRKSYKHLTLNYWWEKTTKFKAIGLVLELLRVRGVEHLVGLLTSFPFLTRCRIMYCGWGEGIIILYRPRTYDLGLHYIFAGRQHSLLCR